MRLAQNNDPLNLELVADLRVQIELLRAGLNKIRVESGDESSRIIAADYLSQWMSWRHEHKRED